jgi:uncharacterized protein (TIGR02453 family)
MPASGRYFTPDLFTFLLELQRNNNREWFRRNRARYEAVARDPALRFVADAGPRLKRISPHLVADPRPVGGSLFRINRDIRFSADKSPYKTNIAMSFGLDAGRGVAPGFYLHLAPRESFAGGGVHMPDTETLRRIRDAIVADPSAWARITRAAPFAPLFTNTGETLKRAPQGYDPQHPMVEDLKRKHYVWHRSFREKDVTATDFLDRYIEACRAAAAFTRFLANALRVAW